LKDEEVRSTSGINEKGGMNSGCCAIASEIKA